METPAPPSENLAETRLGSEVPGVETAAPPPGSTVIPLPPAGHLYHGVFPGGISGEESDMTIDDLRSYTKVSIKKTTEYRIPEEFIRKPEETPGLQQAFDGLTPGRQRACLLYFSAPRQAKTREARIEEYIQHILKGKGLND